MSKEYFDDIIEELEEKYGSYDNIDWDDLSTEYEPNKKHEELTNKYKVRLNYDENDYEYYLTKEEILYIEENGIYFKSISDFETFFIYECQKNLTKEKEVITNKKNMIIGKYNTKGYDNYISARRSERLCKGFYKHYTNIKRRMIKELEINELVNKQTALEEIYNENQLCNNSIIPEIAEQIIETEKTLIEKIKNKWTQYYGKDYADFILSKKNNEEYKNNELCFTYYEILKELDIIRREYVGATVLG